MVVPGSRLLPETEEESLSYLLSLCLLLPWRLLRFLEFRAANYWSGGLLLCCELPHPAPIWLHPYPWQSLCL